MTGAAEAGGLAAALARVQAALPVIPKHRTAKIAMKGGGSYSYKYADLSDVTEAIMPKLAAEGLAWTTTPTMVPDLGFVLAYRLTHAPSGERVDGVWPLADPLRMTMQEVGSALTYARRYALCCVTGVVPDEDDDAQVNTQGRDLAREPAEVVPPAPEDRQAVADGYGDRIRLARTAASVVALKRDAGLAGVVDVEVTWVKASGEEATQTVGALADAVTAYMRRDRSQDTSSA